MRSDALRFIRKRNGGIGQSQSLREGFDDRLQNRIGREGGVEALAEVGEDGRGVITFAVHESIDAALQSLAQRFKKNGNDACGDERK